MTKDPHGDYRDDYEQYRPDRQQNAPPTSNQYVWIPAERIGQIEVREYVHGDQARHTISISEADMNLPTLVGGFIARNPDNHDDQWYIAREYFNKHYRIPVETRERRETGWLIEDGQRRRYRTMHQGAVRWTDDPNKAIRFARRADAEMFAAEDEDAWHVAEHQWVTLDGDSIHAVETECDREDPKARIGSPEHTQAEAIRTLKATCTCKGPGRLRDRNCPVHKEAMGRDWLVPDETLDRSKPENGSGDQR